MCGFCKNLEGSSEKIMWCVRSTMADDNLYESIEELSNEKIVDEECGFKLSNFKFNGDVYFGVEYIHKITTNKKSEINVLPFSESVRFNYCPFCGQQISENLRSFDENDNFGFFISESE